VLLGLQVVLLGLMLLILRITVLLFSFTDSLVCFQMAVDGILIHSLYTRWTHYTPFQMAVDGILCVGFNGHLRLRLLHILLLVQDADEWIPPDVFLFRIHVSSVVYR
jgi:hypothetical protein